MVIPFPYITAKQAAEEVESLGDLVSVHAKDRAKSLFDVSRQWVSKSLKEAAVGRNAILNGVPTPVLQQ